MTAESNWLPTRKTNREKSGPAPAVARIAAMIADAIVRGEFDPGQRLREQELADRFGVSRGPVREALRALERDCLVEITPNRGARVIRLSIGEIDGLFEIRAALTGLCARLAAMNATKRDIDRLADRIDSIADLIKTDPTPQAYIEGSFQTGMVMAEIAGNERARNLLLNFTLQAQWHYSYLGVSTKPRRRQSLANWRKLLKTIEQRDADGAEAAGKALVRSSQALAMRLLRADPEKYFVKRMD